MERIEIDNIINWIKDYVKNAYAKGVVLGMSGGKDSLIVAKLCSLALGEDKVFGIIMPNGEMCDYDDAVRTCKLLKIPYTIIDITSYNNLLIESVDNTLKQLNIPLSEVSTINTPPRLRMTTLYAIAGSLNYLVANTSNLSEIMVGYSTKWGDGVGDFAPIANLTKTEVCELGLLLDLPKELVIKIPSDGLSGKSDEEKLGFTYSSLDTFIRTGEKDKAIDKILSAHKKTAHKRGEIAKYPYNKTNHFYKEN